MKKAKQKRVGQRHPSQKPVQELALAGDLKALIEKLQYFLDQRGNLHVLLQVSEGGPYSSVKWMVDATVGVAGTTGESKVVLLAGYVPENVRKEMRDRTN